jgi:hypothetical protein
LGFFLPLLQQKFNSKPLKTPFKKYFVLTILFVLPLLCYMFFASATHNSLFLPIISKNNHEIPNNFSSLRNEEVNLKNHITILGFPGKDYENIKSNLFNLNQKIYNKYSGFNDFQIVMILPKGNEKNMEDLLIKLRQFSDKLDRWHFLFAENDEIETYFNSFKFQNKLDQNFGTPQVYILDKDINLRGRKGQKIKGKVEYLESYNSISQAVLHNEMGDDVKILLREYRLALKKNNSREDAFRDKISDQIERNKRK